MASVDNHAQSEAIKGSVSRLTAGWFARRALLGILILIFTFGSIAWLTNASIDDGEAIAAQTIDQARGQ